MDTKNLTVKEMASMGGKACLASIGVEGMAELGKKGAKRRTENLTPERRSEIARAAVAARWAREKAKKASKPNETD